MITLYRAAGVPAILSSLARKGGVCFARRRESAECYLRTSHLGGPRLWAYEVEVDVEDLTGPRGPAALAELLGLGDEAVDAWAAEGCHAVWEIIEGDDKIVAALAGLWVRYEEPDVDASGSPLSSTCDTYRFFGGACLLGRPVH